MLNVYIRQNIQSLLQIANSLNYAKDFRAFNVILNTILNGK